MPRKRLNRTPRFQVRPLTETISLRLPAPLLADLKALANARDVPYQSLLKVFLADQVRREQAAAGRHDRRSQPAKKRGASRRKASPG